MTVVQFLLACGRTHCRRWEIYDFRQHSQYHPNRPHHFQNTLFTILHNIRLVHGETGTFVNMFGNRREFSNSLWAVERGLEILQKKKGFTHDRMKTQSDTDVRDCLLMMQLW